MDDSHLDVTGLTHHLADGDLLTGLVQALDRAGWPGGGRITWLDVHGLPIAAIVPASMAERVQSMDRKMGGGG